MSKLTEQQKSVWAEHIQSQLQSDLSQQDYCIQEKLKPHCFWYWKRKLKPVTGIKTAAAKARRKSGFVPVSIASNREPDSLSIVLPDGMTFKGITEHNAPLVQQLIGALK